MKTREGFVSNSSTSSFLCVGFKLTKKPKDIPEKEAEYFVRDSYETEDYFFMVDVAGCSEGMDTQSLVSFEKNYEKAKALVFAKKEELETTAKVEVYYGIIDMGGEGGFIPSTDWDKYDDDDGESDKESDEDKYPPDDDRV
jgi:hypothetical protein